MLKDSLEITWCKIPEIEKENETLGQQNPLVPAAFLQNVCVFEKKNMQPVCSPDKPSLHWIVERHEHLSVLADLTHHVLQSHEEGERWRGGELGLSRQINILLLRLPGKQRRHSED